MNQGKEKDKTRAEGKVTPVCPHCKAPIERWNVARRRLLRDPIRATQTTRWWLPAPPVTRPWGFIPCDGRKKRLMTSAASWAVQKRTLFGTPSRVTESR